MIKDTDGDSFEDMRSLERELTFDIAKQEFQGRRLAFDQPQMKKIGLLNTDGIYTNLSLLLSERYAHTVKAAVFEGGDQRVFRDRQEFSGSLLGQLNAVYDYIDRRNQVRSTFDKLRRIDERDYPEVAIREALLNSLVHRDYSYSASTLVNIYDDRIEFTSIGGLMSGFSMDDILLGLSICRKPKLANVFYRLQLIEAYGTGMNKIIRAYDHSGKRTLIETTDNAFKITLPNLHEGTEKVRESPKNDLEDKVLRFVADSGSISRKETQEVTGLGQTAAGRLLKGMVEELILVQVGRGRNTKYEPKVKEREN